MGVVEIVLVRHGATEWATSGRHTGSTDIPLDDQGREQAKALGARLADWNFSLVLTSPLQRGGRPVSSRGSGIARRSTPTCASGTTATTRG